MAFEGEFQIEEWLVKPHTNTIVGPDGEAHVEPKAMQVLVLLASRAGDVVSKQSILTEVWDGTYVSEEVLPNAVWEVRKALGDDARKPRFIQTVPKKGYRLIAPVETPSKETEPPSVGSAAGVWRLFASKWSGGAVAATAVIVVALVFSARSDTRMADPSSVLVLDFDNQTNAEDLDWLSSGAPTMLRTGLAEVSGLTVVSTQRLEQAIAEVGPESRSSMDVARRSGAGAVVLGSFFRLGPEYRIDVQVEDVNDARIIAAHSVRGEDVFQLMDDLTQRVSDSLRGEGASSEPVPPLREMTTPSLDAFRLYNEGVVARRHLRIADARAALTEAVRIDPEFALAYAELQMVAGISRDEAAYERLGEKVLALKDRLPPHQRLLLDVTSRHEEDPARAEADLIALIERKPDEEEAYVKLSHLSEPEGGKNLLVLERGVEALPYSGYLRLLYGYALLRQGRYTDAIRQFEAYARIDPKEANPMDSLGEAYLVAGNPERALEYYGRALVIDPNFAASHVGRSWAFAQTGRYDEALTEIDAIQGDLPPGFSRAELDFQRAYILTRAGRYRDAEALLGRVEAEAVAEGVTTYVAVVRLLQSLFAIEQSDFTTGRAKAEKAKTLLPTDTESTGNRRLRQLAGLFGGVAACGLGDTAFAMEALSEIEASVTKGPQERWWYHLLLGEIALSRKQPEAAAKAFTDGLPQHKMPFNVIRLLENLGGSLSLRDGGARAKALAGDRRGAIAMYDRLLRPDIGLMWTAMLEPRYHLALARLHREGGDRVRASEHYRELLRLWAQADSDLSEIAEAESYLASS